MKLKLTNTGMQELGQKLKPTQLALGQHAALELRDPRS